MVPTSLRALRAGLMLLVMSFSLWLTACGGGDDGGSSPPAAATGTVAGQAVAADSGLPLAGVTVTLGTASATTGSDGRYSIAKVPAAERAVMSYKRAGYAPGGMTVAVLANATSRADARLTPVAASRQFAAAAGATVVVPNSAAQVVLPANGLIVSSTGAAATGTVTVELTPIDPAQNPANMPGDYSARAADGSSGRIDSFGALNVSLRDAAGNALNLAAGQTATLRIPVATRSADVPATIPLFYYDEAAGLWIEDGTATLVGTGPGRYYEGTVKHFTTWNCDRIGQTVYVHGCLNDGKGAPIVQAEVNSYGLDYSGQGSAITDAKGLFSVPIRANSKANIAAFVDPGFSNVVKVGPSSVDITLTTCLVLGGGGAPPVIVTQPVSITADPAGSVYFLGEAIGSSPLRYQWQRDGVAISGQTQPYLILYALQPSDSGARFRLVVTNDYGSATSDEAVLTVNATPTAPTILSQPQAQTVAVGAAATFSVGLIDTRPVTYQWQRNGVAIAGATSSSYTTPATVLADNGASFRVVVSVQGASVTSGAAILTVQAAVAPTIAQPPANASINVGLNAVFSVQASGIGPIGYQWLRNGSAISGATAATYLTPAVTLADSGSRYSVKVSNAFGSTTSPEARLTVTQPTGAAGLYLLAEAGPSVVGGSITYADGASPITGKALVLVNTAAPTTAITLESAGSVAYTYAGFFEGQVSGSTISKLHQRFGLYFKGNRLNKVDLQVASGLPAGQPVSSLRSTEVCGPLFAQSTGAANGDDIVDASRSWTFLRAPGANGVCGDADDAYRAVRMNMSATDAAPTIGEPLAEGRDASGALTRVIVRNGSTVQQLDANLANAITLFTLAQPIQQNYGAAFGSTATGVWLFQDSSTLYGYKLGSGATAPTPLVTLALGESVVGTIVSDGADAFVAMNSAAGTSRILRLTDTLTASAVATSSDSTLALALTPSRVVVWSRGSGTGASTVSSVARSGGSLTTLVPSSTWITGNVIASGENVYYQQTSIAPDSTQTFRVGIIGADGSNPALLANTAIAGQIGASAFALTRSFGQIYAIVLADGTNASGLYAGSTLRAVEGASRNALVSYGAVQASPQAYVVLSSFLAQYGGPGLFSFFATTATSPTDLYYFKSDAAGLTKLTSFVSPTAP